MFLKLLRNQAKQLHSMKTLRIRHFFNYSRSFPSSTNVLLHSNINKRNFFTKKDAIDGTNRAWNAIKSYKVGVIGGIGAFTSIGVMFYIFSPTINKKSTKTATNVLTSDEVYQKATVLTKNITGELLKDDATYVLLCDLVIQVLKNDKVNEEFVNMLSTTMKKPEAIKITKQFVIEIIQDPEVEEALTKLLLSSSRKVLDDPEFQQSASKSIKRALRNLLPI